MNMSIAITLTLLAFIVAVELLHWRTRRCFGLLSVTNLVFILAYCLTPSLLALLRGTAFETDPYGTRLFMFDVADKLALNGGAYTAAALMSVFAYVVMVSAYAGVSRLERPHPLNGPQGKDAVPTTWLVMWGLVLGAVALTALLIYSSGMNALDDDRLRLLLGKRTMNNFYDDGFGLHRMIRLGGGASFREA